MGNRYLGITLLLFLPFSFATAQWQKSPDFPNDFFNEVQFVDNTHGWVTRMNATVSRTVDGGASWQSSTLPGGTNSSNRDLCFLSRTIGFASGEDGVWKTANGGVTWTSITPPGFSGGSASVWFTDANNGVAGIGACTDSTVKFFKTTDAGASWTSVAYTSSQDVSVGGIAFANGVWIVSGGRGKLWRSNDGGSSWTMTNTGSNGWQEDIITYGNDVLIASTTGSACGIAGGGTVLRSSNGGSNWTTTTFPSNLMWGVTRYSPTDGWACGDGGLALKTTDGGNTWIDQSCGLPRGIRVDDISVTDATHGWAVGDGLYHLTDGSITVSPDTIDFGAISVGKKSADSNAVIRSFFTTITSATVRIAGTDFTQFGLGTGGLTIPVGVCSSSPAAVHFAPTSLGLKTALLEVTVQGSAVRQLVVLKGRAIQGEISVMAKPALDTMVCGVTAVDSILIRNIGTGPLTIKDVRHIDSPGGLLRRISPELPQTIVPGGMMWMKVEATAYTPGSFESTLEIISDDLAHTPMTVKMRFNRRRFATALNTDLLTLPAVPIGIRSNEACIEYSNRGDAAQIITAVEPIGGDPSIMLSTFALPVSVPAGGTARLCFTATPGDTGLFERRYTIRTSPCGRDTSITVRVYGHSSIIRSDTVVAMPGISCARSSRSVIPISNDGNDTLILGQPVVGGPDERGVSIVSPTEWPLRIAPKSSATITVELEPQSAAPSSSATLTFATNDRYPGKSSWSIRVSTVRSSAIARPTVASTDLGSICMGNSRDVTLHVESVGNADAHVTSATLLGTDATATSIFLPPTGATLPPGTRDSLVLRVAPTTRGAFSSMIEIRTEPCGRIDTVTVTGVATEVSLATDDALALGTLLHKRPSTATVRVRNDGNAAAIITEASTKPASRVTVMNQLPFTIAANGFVDLDLVINTDITGPIAERIHLVAADECADVLDLDVSGIVVDAGGISLLVHTREISFAPMFRCEDECGFVELESVGERPVSITNMRIDGGANAFRIDTLVSTAEILPGERLEIPVCYSPVTDADEVDAMLVLTTSDTAMTEVRIPLHASSMRGLGTDAELSFGIVADSLAFDTTITISNPSSRPLDILWARVPAPFSVETSMPQTVPAHGALTIVVRARDIEAFARERLVLGTSHPCGDSIVVVLQALSDDRFVVTASADTSVGRWGQTVSVPIRYTDTTRARVAEIELVVTASPTMLDPRAITAAPGLLVEQTGFDASTGRLTLHVHSSDGLPIVSNDNLVSIEYDVLRGDAIATSIVPVVLGLRPGIASESAPGAFMLEDYCDAHRRLLRTTGQILLMQNTPNPAKARTVIEFESSFDGNVILAIFDLRGNEVKRVVDEWMPAGRRRVEVSTSDLPAGAYTYRLLTGLQSLSRRLVVTP